MTASPGRPEAPVGFAVAVIAASLFAWLGPLSRWAYEGGLEPLAFAAWRAGVAFVVVSGVVAIARQRGRGLVAPGSLTGREAASLAVAMAAALAVNLTIFAAFARVSIAIALIGFYTYPAIVALGALLLGREEPSASVLGALVLALVGMALVVAGSLDPAVGAIAVDAFGIALALTAAVAQAVFVLVSRDGYARLPAEQATAAILGGTLAGCVAVGLVGGLGAELGTPLAEPRLLPIVLAAGAAGAAIPTLLFLTAIRIIGGLRAGILMLLEPVVGVVLAALLLGEGVRPVQAAGGLAVLGGALVLRRAQRSRPGPGRQEAEPVLTGHEAIPEARTTR